MFSPRKGGDGPCTPKTFAKFYELTNQRGEGHNGVYVVGSLCTGERIAVSSQQTRAINVNNPGLGPRIVPALFIEWKNTCQLGLEIINRILDCGRCVNEARTRRNVKPWPCGIAETRMAETRG